MSEQSKWGQRVHKILEDAVNWGDPLPSDFKKWKGVVDQIQAMPGEKFPEFRFSIDSAYHPCSWKDSWARGVADLVIKKGTEAIVIDYKTGKRRPSDQLALYAGFAFAYWPELKTVHTCYVWLQDRKLDRATYTADKIHEIWQLWLPAVARLERAYDRDQWQKRPSGLCRKWCPVKDCQFCGE